MKIFSKFPSVRLKQFVDYPPFIGYFLLRLFVYKYTSHKYIPLYKGFRFMSPQETLAYLIKNDASIVRFGDGDMEQLTGAGEYPPDSDWSQRASKALQKRLGEVLASRDDQLLVAPVSPDLFLVSKDRADGKKVIYNMWTDTRRLLIRYIHKDRVYGDANVFIPAHHQDFDWKRLAEYLQERTVIIVTGGTETLSGIRLGKQTLFVECGKDDAFEKLDKIKTDLRSCIEKSGVPKESILVMASLGPTADILAYDMLDEGITIWDTGHFFKYAFEQIVMNSKEHNYAE